MRPSDCVERQVVHSFPVEAPDQISHLKKGPIEKILAAPGAIDAIMSRIEHQRRKEEFRSARQFIRNEAERWRTTVSIQPNQRLQYYNSYLRTTHPIYRTDLVTDGVTFFGSALLAISLFSLFIGLPIAYGDHLIRFETSLWPLNVIIYILTSILNVFVIVLVTIIFVIPWYLLLFLFSSQWVNTTAVIGFLISVALAGFILYQLWDDDFRTLSFFYSLAFVSSLFFIGFVLIGFTVVLLLASSLIAIRGWSSWRYPYAFLIRYLMEAVRQLEAAGERWTDIEVRAELMAKIARAGAIVRGPLFRSFRCRDGATFIWRMQQTNLISAALLEKQRWLITPKADTREVLLEWFARTIVALVSGTWDDLELLLEGESPGEPAQALSSWRRARNLAFGASRTVSVAILPALLFVAGSWANLFNGMSSGVVDYIRVGLFVWAAVSLMFMLDPLIKDKIEALKQAASIVIPGGKKE
jgi:hypothetical protein